MYIDYGMSSNNVSRELIAASSEPMILSILAQEENYGYAIIQKVRLCSREQIRWTDGMLYPVLHRMESRGLIKARWGDAQAGPRRKYYRLTSKGKRCLAQQREEWQTVNQTLNALWKESHV